MKALKSRRVQETTTVHPRLDEKLASLIGGDKVSVSRARVVVDRLDDETASRLDRVTDVNVKSLVRPRGAPTAVDLQVDPAADSAATPIN